MVKYPKSTIYKLYKNIKQNRKIHFYKHLIYTLLMNIKLHFENEK